MASTLNQGGTGGYGGSVRFFYKGETWPAAYARIEARPTVKLGVTVNLPPSRQDWADGWGRIPLSTLAPAPAWPTTNLTLVDEPAGRSFTVPMKDAEHVLPWDRPVPIGVISGQEYTGLDEFVKALCARYREMESKRPSPIGAWVIWCGSPALSPPISWVIIQLRTRLVGARTNALVTDAEKGALANETPRRVYEELRTVLPLRETKDLKAGFLEALHQMVELTRKRLDSRLGRVTAALLRAVGIPPAGSLVESAEDFAGTTMAVFFLGLLAYGYRHGTVRSDNDDNPLYKVGASMRLG